MLGLGIGEAAAGIAMIRASVSFIKENISTAKDIGEIAEHIDNLFVGQSKVNKQTKMAPGQFSIGAIARETVDAKLAAEYLYDVSVLIDQRFGHGTWKGILAERQKRIKDFKDRQAKEARRKALARKEMWNDAKLLLYITGGSIVLVVGVLGYITLVD